MLSINLGRSVLEKNCALGLEYLKTKGTVFLNMDLPGWRLTYISYAAIPIFKIIKQFLYNDLQLC